MAGIDSVVNEYYNQRMFIIDKSMKPWATLWESFSNKNEK
jgi:hypothetical protein